MRGCIVWGWGGGVGDYRGCIPWGCTKDLDRIEGCTEGGGIPPGGLNLLFTDYDSERNFCENYVFTNNWRILSIRTVSMTANRII